VRGVAEHASAPPTQLIVPAVTQVPVPEDEHPAPPPGLPSSTVPSQSSSTPLQASVVGERVITFVGHSADEPVQLSAGSQAATDVDARHT